MVFACGSSLDRSMEGRGMSLFPGEGGLSVPLPEAELAMEPWASLYQPGSPLLVHLCLPQRLVHSFLLETFHRVVGDTVYYPSAGVISVYNTNE